MSNEIVGYVITAVLGGGFARGVSSILEGRALARKLKAQTASIDGEAPARVDSIAVQGAETAVLTLQRSLQLETRRADRAEAREAEKDRRIELLEKKLDAVQALLDEARSEIQALAASVKH